MAASSSSSTVKERIPQDQVFINFRGGGGDLRLGFVSHLVTALKNLEINVFIDDYEERGKNLEILLKRIEESRIALAIFSRNYTNSIWCIKELAKIKDCADEEKLVAIPIFYKLEPSTVGKVKGEFGDAFRVLAKGHEKKKEWKEALKAISERMRFTINEKSVESEIIKQIVKAVKEEVLKIPLKGSQNASVNPSEDTNAVISSGGENRKTFGNEQRLKELKEKLDPNKYKGTRIIRVVGMPVIGKTTLLKEFYKTWQRRFNRHALIDKIHDKSKHLKKFDFLPHMLLSKLNNSDIQNFRDIYSQLRERKLLVILDDVSKREQLDAFLEVLDLIKNCKEAVPTKSKLKHSPTSSFFINILRAYFGNASWLYLYR